MVPASAQYVVSNGGLNISRYASRGRKARHTSASARASFDLNNPCTVAADLAGVQVAGETGCAPERGLHDGANLAPGVLIGGKRKHRGPRSGDRTPKRAGGERRLLDRGKSWNKRSANRFDQAVVNAAAEEREIAGRQRRDQRRDIAEVWHDFVDRV